MWTAWRPTSLRHCGGEGHGRDEVEVEGVLRQSCMLAFLSNAGFINRAFQSWADANGSPRARSTHGELRTMNIFMGQRK